MIKTDNKPNPRLLLKYATAAMAKRSIPIPIGEVNKKRITDGEIYDAKMNTMKRIIYIMISIFVAFSFIVNYIITTL